MQFRQILLVHPSRGFRGLIKKFVFAEFSDIEITETDTTEEALRLAGSRAFNAVLAAGDADARFTMDFMTSLKESRCNPQTPFIVLCEKECGKIPQAEQKERFEHVVHIRLRPADLIRKINEVCNPRQLRKDERFYLPNARLAVAGGDLLAEAELINISRGGVLVEMRTDAPELLMMNDINLNLQVPTPSQAFDIPHLKSKLLRLSVADWHADKTPAAMRVTFLFSDLEPQTQSRLYGLLEQAQYDQRQGMQGEEAN